MDPHLSQQPENNTNNPKNSMTGATTSQATRKIMYPAMDIRYRDMTRELMTAQSSKRAAKA